MNETLIENLSEMVEDYGIEDVLGALEFVTRGNAKKNPRSRKFWVSIASDLCALVVKNSI